MQKSVKEHIQNYWINEVGDLVKNHAFMSFGIIGVGIEFLGKCLDYYTPWLSTANTSKWHFELAIRKLPSLNKYRCFINYTPQPKCQAIDKNLLKASQITGNTDVKNDIDAAKSKIDAYNRDASAESSTTSSPEALTNNKICDLFEKNIGNVSKAYFDNDKNADLGEAIKNLQSAQSKFKSTNDMHPIKLDLYAELRCGMAHAGLPGRHLLLTPNTGKSLFHVKDDSGQITHWILDAKALYDDFQGACVELMNWADPKVQANINTPLIKTSRVHL